MTKKNEEQTDTRGAHLQYLAGVRATASTAWGDSR